MTIPQKREAMPASTIEDVLVKGNLADLTPSQRTEYYAKMCQSLGLNPLTQPFSYITLNNKLVLYANRACTDQLRKINGISIQIVSQDKSEGLLSVHVKATDKTGRTDEDLGVVSVANLRGEAAANAALKAITKAKRRVTLSISGLGYLDETEIEDIPAGAKAPTVDEPHDIDMGEIKSNRERFFETPRKIAKPLLDDGSNDTDWIDWGAQLLAAVRASPTKAVADQWLRENADTMSQCAQEATKVSTRLIAAIRAAGADLPSEAVE